MQLGALEGDASKMLLAGRHAVTACASRREESAFPGVFTREGKVGVKLFRLYAL
jgi:hypothetical protein